MAKSKNEDAPEIGVPEIEEGPAGVPVIQDAAGNAPASPREPVIYCGPSVPKGKIISGSLYRGGLPKNIEAMIGKIPEIGKLIVPVGKLAETQRKIAVAGTEENRLYQAVLSRRGETGNV